MSDKPTIYELMGKAFAELPAIPKSGQAPANMGGYKFRRQEDVAGALRAVFAPYGVFPAVSTLEKADLERTTKSGALLYVVRVHIAVKFYGPAGDSVESDAWGEGTDSGDKATQKAYTAAAKSLLGIDFLVADEADDAESHDVPETHEQRGRRSPPAQPPVADHAVHEALRHMIADLPPKPLASLQAWWATEQLPPIKKADRLTEPQIEAAMAYIESLGVAEPPSASEDAKDGTEPFSEPGAAA